MKENLISIEMTMEEAIVLFEFLGRIKGQDDPNLFLHQSEQRVLWDIECILEKILSEPFRADYQEIVQKARELVKDKEE